MKKVSKKKSTKKSVKSVSNKIVEKKRGFFLTFWLALILTGNIVAAFFYLFWADLIVQIAETIPVWSIYTLGILGLVNIVLILNLFMWKKWAFYGIIGSGAIAFVINILTNQGFWMSLISWALGVLILYLAMRSSWKHFR